MELQAVDRGANLTSAAVADEVRAELARQRKTAADLARVLGLSAHTTGRRLNGDAPFDVTELAVTAGWLGLSVSALVARAESREEVAS